MYKKAIVAILSCSLLLTGLSGCGSNQESENQKDTIKLGYVNWTDTAAITNLAAAVLQEKMGYDVDMVMADIAPVLTSVSRGGTDAYLNVWLPDTHKAYVDKFGDDMIDLGTLHESARNGFVVPSYVEVDSIEELNENKDVFGDQIVGVDAGAGIMTVAEQVVKDYDLDLQLITGSDATMTAALSKAIQKKEPIVVTGWAPHWMMARWDLEFLDDPKGAFGEAESAHKYVRKGFEEDQPEAARFMKKFTLSIDDLSDIMEKIDSSSEDEYEVVKDWMNDHEELVDSWIK